MTLRRILFWSLGGLVVLAILTPVVAWILSRPATPDAFYSSAQPRGAPGTLLAVEPYTFEVPAGAVAWRVLYSTTRMDGSAAVASAIVMTPAGATADPLPAVAWAHGTTGIAPGCAPSIFGPFDNVPAVSELLAEGWAYVATDYVGLGTDGGHAYLVGADAARAVLDSVRAASQMSEASIAPRAVVWGHSQGGNSALWTGMLAPGYAPDVEVLGVAAMAPASDLGPLLNSARKGMFGKIVSSFVMRAYDETYEDVATADYVDGLAGVLAPDIAGRCVGGWGTLFSVAETTLLPAEGIFRTDPTTGALGARLAENTPRGPFAMPVLLTQGTADDLVLANIQDGFVAGLCTAGAPVNYRLFEGLDHLTLVASDSPMIQPLIGWTRDRFAGQAPGQSCDAS